MARLDSTGIPKSKNVYIYMVTRIYAYIQRIISSFTL